MAFVYQLLKGTGLGLSIARVFVEAHGGRIGVEPASPTGAVFRIRLPLRPSPTRGLCPKSPVLIRNRSGLIHNPP